MFIEFLHERWVIFAWCPADMPGVRRELTENALNIYPSAKPVRQSLRQFAEPKCKEIAKELHGL
jgi:hypothetical protein